MKHVCYVFDTILADFHIVSVLHELNSIGNVKGQSQEQVKNMKNKFLSF